MVSGAILVEAMDAHFAWMLDEGPPPDRLSLPPGGIDEAWVLRWLRRNLARFGQPGNWLVVADGEVVGLCSHKTGPNADGAVEIGYGVAPSRQRRGHATRAVAGMLQIAGDDPAVKVVLAATSVDNPASQRCLIKNGFVETGRKIDPEDGPVIMWRRELG